MRIQSRKWLANRTTDSSLISKSTVLVVTFVFVCYVLLFWWQSLYLPIISYHNARHREYVYKYNNYLYADMHGNGLITALLVRWLEFLHLMALSKSTEHSSMNLARNILENFGKFATAIEVIWIMFSDWFQSSAIALNCTQTTKSLSSNYSCLDVR